ncbi:unnamed protein product [Phaedon cochleariae]|uniref:Double jelly roll-like domain-containing protein n=1 Tax=Phaedon cochleariae TaxID=80249 RepID=A0A9N9SDP3_PHACE|nr:unnamed protein product [Phaedon cochleariae]
MDLQIESLSLEEKVNLILKTVIKTENEELKKRVNHLENHLNRLEKMAIQKNVFVYGIPSDEHENVENIEKKVLEVIHRNLDLPSISELDLEMTRRIGRKGDILVTFSSLKAKSKVMQKSKNLMNTPFAISHHYTQQARQERKLLNGHLENALKTGLRAQIKNNRLVIDDKTFTLEECSTLPVLTANSADEPVRENIPGRVGRPNTRSNSSGDHLLMSLHEHTYKPYGSPSFKNSDEIRIAVNFQDLILDISESYIYIEGKFTPNDATKTCYLSNNALAFLFDEIRYEMGGEQVCMVRKPGITTTMKSMISYGESNMKFLETIGWGLDGGKQVLLDKASNVFSGKLPLKYLMGFAEDYCRGILNIKQELILIIARSFKNSYIGEVDADVEINKIEWKIRHVMPSDKQKLKLLTRLNKSSTAKVKIAYRMWDLYELPTIRDTASDIWAVKTTNSLERPRYIIIGFQNTDNTDNRSEDITQFTHAGVSNIRLYLNSEVYPYERWNLDFDKKLDAVAYYAYDNFQRSYYGKDMSEPMMSIEEFRKNPLFIIDCNHQPDAMKSSTVDIKVRQRCQRVLRESKKKKKKHRRS